MTIETRVQNGVDWLNEFGPAEWWDRVDLDKLNIELGWTCILGQVFAAAADETGLADGYTYMLWTFDGESVSADPIRHGFCSVDDRLRLEIEWIRVIERIRAEVNA